MGIELVKRAERSAAMALLSPLIAIGLMTAYKPETWPISVYMIALALITTVSVYFAKETRTKSEA